MNQTKILPVTENYDHIELTDAEQTEALRLARKAKHFKIENENYWKKVSQPVEYPKFDFKQMREFAVQKLIQHCGSDFKINEYNSKIIDQLALYFSNNIRFEEEHGLSLDKGIFLVGPIGCGKTTIMKAFSINTHNSYSLVSTRLVSDEYTKNGIEGAERFFGLQPVHPQQYYGQKEIGFCFDDLGTESSKKHFGNELNVINDIILSRYDKNLKGKTHFTGNLTGDEIDEIYGSRVRSRLREMCNFIAFDTQASDFRK